MDIPFNPKTMRIPNLAGYPLGSTFGYCPNPACFNPHQTSADAKAFVGYCPQCGTGLRLWKRETEDGAFILENIRGRLVKA